MEPTDLAGRLKIAEKASGIKPAPAAERAGLQVDYVRDVLRRKKKDVPATALVKLAEAYGVDFQWLATGTGDPPKVASFDREDRGTVRTTDGMAEPAPTGRDQLQALWRRLSEPQRLRLIAFAEGMLAEQAPPPPAAEPPPPAAAPADTVTSRLKPRPAVDKIGGRRPLHVYLAQWLESRGWEPVDLAKRVNVPGAVPDAIEGLISGKYGYDQEWLYEIAKALGVAMEKLYELPPARAKLATKGGKRQSTRR
jgi:transcriptional regulator with XRE-family HTH domain